MFVTLTFMLSVGLLLLLLWGMLNPKKAFLGSDTSRVRVAKFYGFWFVASFIVFLIAVPKADDTKTESHPPSLAARPATDPGALRRASTEDVLAAEQRKRDLSDPKFRSAMDLMLYRNRVVGAMMRYNPDLYSGVQGDVQRCQIQINDALSGNNISQKTRVILYCVENVLNVCLNNNLPGGDCDRLNEAYTLHIQKH